MKLKQKNELFQKGENELKKMLKNAKENLNSETNFIICSFLFMLLIGLILFIIYPSILCGRKLIFLIHYLNT